MTREERKERAAVLDLLDRELEIAEVHDLLVGTVRLRQLRDIIERGEHRKEEHVEVSNEERAAVVAFLREGDTVCMQCGDRGLRQLRDIIERGEHRKEKA
jgi:hypothetical protein